jgi:hypothetical protein
MLVLHCLMLSQLFGNPLARQKSVFPQQRPSALLDLPRKRVDARPGLPDIPLPRQWMQFGVRVTPTESTAESTVGNGFTQSCAKM